MGYFNIIDSLSDKRVDEGMVSSISKNTKKQNKDTKRMVDAVLSGQISKLYSKLKLPTLGCRLTISIISSKEAKNVLKMLKGIGVDSCVNSLKVVGTSLVIEVY